MTLSNIVSQQIVSVLVNSSAYYTIQIGLNGTYIYANPHFESVFADEGKSLIGQPWSHSIHKDDLSNVGQIIADCVSQPGISKPVITRKNLAGDEIILTYWELTCVANNSGEFDSIICIGYNITHKEINEWELNACQLKLTAIMDSSLESYILIGLNKEVLNFNKTGKYQCETIFGKTPLIGDPIHSYISEDLLAEFNIHFETAIKGTPVKSQQLVKMATGNSIWIEFNYYPVFNDSNLLLGVSLNATIINDQKIAELKVKEQNEKLKKIAFIQSHELRAPLTNIMGVVELLDIFKEKIDSPEIFVLLRALSETAEQMDAIIKKIVGATVDV
jgi:PAS domain S-box-containing protein